MSSHCQSAVFLTARALYFSLPERCIPGISHYQSAVFPVFLTTRPHSLYARPRKTRVGKDTLPAAAIKRRFAWYLLSPRTSKIPLWQ